MWGKEGDSGTFSNDDDDDDDGCVTRAWRGAALETDELEDWGATSLSPLARKKHSELMQ